MTLGELSSNQITYLKQSYLCTHMENPSWGDLATADSTVTYEMLEAEYGATVFVPEDFF